MRRECPRSAEVAAAVAAGCAFDGGSDLQLHVAACASCADLVLVASALRAERDRTRRAAAVPSAGLVWWRAQLRRRQAAARTAAALVTLLEAAAVLFAVGVALFLAWTAAHTGTVSALAAYLPSMPSWSGLEPADSSATIPLTTWAMALGAAAWLILAPVALYFALRRD